MDIVFVTNSSSAHPLLEKWYKPVVHFGDEAALTSIADSITPMATFMDTLEHIFLGGDHKQQRPIVHSKGGNEFHELLDTSLFELLFANEIFTGEYKFGLNEQRRMHPQISNLVGEVMYEKMIDGGLKDHGSTKQIKPKATTMEAFLRERLGVAWNGLSRRLLLNARGKDSNGNDITAAQPANSTSWQNEEEANMIADFIQKACEFPPPIEGEQLTPSDFLVLSPYAVQCSLIVYKLGERKIGKRNIRVRVINSRAVQSTEGDFVLFSMTRTDPLNPLKLGLAGDRNLLNVSLSRAKQFLFCFGNWAALLNVMFKGVGEGKPNPLDPKQQNARFHVLAKCMKYCFDHREVIASDDLRLLLRDREPASEPAILSQAKNPSASHEVCERSTRDMTRTNFIEGTYQRPRS